MDPNHRVPPTALTAPREPFVHLLDSGTWHLVLMRLREALHIPDQRTAFPAGLQGKNRWAVYHQVRSRLRSESGVAGSVAQALGSGHA